LFDRNFFSQLEDERNDTETRLEKMSRDMEGVYQSKVTEKLQKLEESKQNVNKILFESMRENFFF
jgi:Skp family chaperone for outer membrane proteins